MENEFWTACGVILATILSLISLGLTIIFNIKTNNKNLNAKIFEKLYFDIILSDLPKELSLLSRKGTNIKEVDVEKLENHIMTLLERSLFYKYFNYDFYSEIKGRVTEIDDSVQRLICNKDFSDVVRLKANIDENASQLYNLLKVEYTKISIK